MSRRNVSRRRFLSSLGAGAALLPFLRALPSYAQSDCAPKLVTVFSPNGRVRHLWGADAGPSGLQLRPNLAPLAPYREHLLIPRGIRAPSADDAGGTHEGGTKCLWTGGLGVPSIDALMMTQAGAGLPRSDSLYQQVVGKLSTAENAGPNNRVAFQEVLDPTTQKKVVTARDPLRSGPEVVELYFGSLLSGNSGATGDEAKQAVAQTALLDALNAQLGSLAPRLCSEDRQKLEVMRAALDTVRGNVLKECALPSVPPNPASQPWEKVWRPPADTIDLAAADDWYRQRGRTAIDLLVAALACGLTRASVLQFDQAASEARATKHSSHHHDLSHTAPLLNQFVQTIRPGSEPPYMELIGDSQDAPSAQMLATFAEPWRLLSEWELFYAEQVAYLLSQLQAFGIMKDTLVVWGTEINNGPNHDHYDMPFLLAAGPCLPLKRGQIVQFPTVFEEPRIAVAPPGTPRNHQDLLRTVLHAVGVDVDAVGDARYNGGLLTELLALT